MVQILWKPDAERANSSLLARFMREAGSFENYDDLWRWSVDAPEAFWSLAWDFCEVVGEKGERILEDGDQTEKARFFPDARLNLAENLLRNTGGESAITFVGEDGTTKSWSWDDLRNVVSRLQQALAAAGVGQGDRVAGYMPNCPETIAAMLATASLGAVWSSCSPDFGVNSVSDRFGQIEPKVLFCVDAYHYNGKVHDSLGAAVELQRVMPSIGTIVVTPFVEPNPDLSKLGAAAVSIGEFVSDFEAKEPEFLRLPFNAPLFIMFSSGTTGLPKCIVHGHGGTVLQHAKEMRLHCDMRPGDRLMYFTTCGWMMWNWMVSALGAGVELVLYDGSPFYPDGERLADIVAAEDVTHFGTSAKYLDACAKAGVEPAQTHDLSALRVLLSTGSPLSPEGFDYVYEAWKKDLCLSSIAGGTDILGCFVGGSPIDPVYRGQVQKRLLGMNVQVFDQEGNALQGEQGELVCTSPHPSQPVGFWNDPDGERYHNAYFARFPNVWHHGDFVELTAEGGMIFYGRSDATLNPGGVRIGTAEIYRQVERIEEVLEALVIGQNWENDVRVVLFVRLRDGVALSEELARRIKSEIRANASPRHVPSKIIAVADIPRTKSGKITELAVRDIVHGRPVKNQGSLANPEALKLFENLPELQE